KTTTVQEKPTIELLIATQNREDINFLSRMFPNILPPEVSLLIVNQSKEKVLKTDNSHIKVINSTKTGLSKSRNLALKHATADICVFTDDDVVFKKDFAATIWKGFTRFPNSSLIQFPYDKAEGVWAKKYPKKLIKNLSQFQLLNVSSIEIAIKRKDI